MEDNIKQAIETYNKYAKVYADRHIDKVLQFQLNEFISKLTGKKVLDVGCGAGRDVQYFKEEGIDVIGIDTSDGLLAEAKKRFPECSFQKMDMLDMKLPEDSFDGVWMMASMADVPKKDVPKLLESVNKIMKSGAVIYIAVKEGDGEQLIKKEQYDNSLRFYSFFRKPELEDCLKKANFKIVSAIVSDDEGTKWVEVTARKI